ncbi:MAG: nucleotidyltransferase family protein [Verrucomicrobiota bacterium]
MLAAHKLNDSCLGLGKPLSAAIGALNGPAEGLAIIRENDGTVTGILTDGDVRRALMKEGSLDACIDPYIKRDFLFVSENETREQVLDLMQATKIKHLPILDGSRKLVGLHRMHDIIGPEKLPNWAVIMAGGKGVRLRPITEYLPKPMIPVAGRPILERLVIHLVGCGFTRIYLSVNYLAEIIERHFGDGSKFGCEIRYLHETEELGTGGALSLLPDTPEDPLVVLNGDLVTQMNFASMLAAHVGSGSEATIGYRSYTHQVPFGCLDLKEGLVTCIQEKPVIERCVNAGVYVISPGVLSFVPKTFFPITELFQTLIDQGKRVGAFEIISDWTDVGQHSELNKARGHL